MISKLHNNEFWYKKVKGKSNKMEDKTMKNFIYSKAIFLILSICFTLGLLTSHKVFIAESTVNDLTSKLTFIRSRQS